VNFLSRIPIGQYIPGRSFVHRLDPRSKLLFTLLFVFLIFLADEPRTYLFLIGFTLLSLFASRISLTYLFRSLKPIIWLILLTVLVHVFMTKGGNIVWEWKWITVYEEGVRQAILISVRLIVLIVMASLLTLTTSPLDLTDGIERLLQPATRFGFPAHDLAMMMSIALRFIPTLLEEMDKIMKAQMSRGAYFDSGGLVKRTQALVPLLIPLFVSAFRRAEELALAMEARGYRGAIGRTKLRELAWTRTDGVFLVIVIILVALFFLIKLW